MRVRYLCHTFELSAIDSDRLVLAMLKPLRSDDDANGMSERQAKRDIVFGTIGLVWGSVIVINSLMNLDWSPAGAYEMGGLFALLFGVLFAVAGFAYKRRGRQTLRKLREQPQFQSQP